MHAEIRPHRMNVADALSDEVLHQLCVCLPGRELLRFSAAAKSLHEMTTGSENIWKRLCYASLGQSLCQLHLTFMSRKRATIDVHFWKDLFRKGREFHSAAWSPEMRAEFMGISGIGQDLSDEAQEEIKAATVGSGHCTVGIGSYVVKTGGLRPNCRMDYLHTAIFDLSALKVHELALTPDSEKPARRLRHASCAIRPALTDGQNAVLVLGGFNDRNKQPCEGGLYVLHVLELFYDEAFSGRWHSVRAQGEAPESIWHHICGSFAGGKKVVVFGGDFEQRDPQFKHIRRRTSPAGFVYLLDVDGKQWERVQTSGPSPTWRSLHSGFTHTDVSSHSERLVVLGGCEAHVPCLGSSDALAPMRGHALDLKTLMWTSSGQDGLPPPRLRLASEKVGEWLLLYGGHGDGEAINERRQLHKLNLRTLQWGTVEVSGREGSYAASPAASMCSGLVVGGVKFTAIGIATVPKLDVLVLCDDRKEGEDSAGEEEQESSSDAGSDDRVVVETRDMDGNTRRIALPQNLLAMLLARRSRARAAAEEDDDGPAASSGAADEDDDT